MVCLHHTDTQVWYYIKWWYEVELQTRKRNKPPGLFLCGLDTKLFMKFKLSSKRGNSKLRQTIVTVVDWEFLSTGICYFFISSVFPQSFIFLVKKPILFDSPITLINNICLVFLLFYIVVYIFLWGGRQLVSLATSPESPFCQSMGGFLLGL